MFIQKETIFTSMLKRFTGAFASVFGFLLALIFIGFILGFSQMGSAVKADLMVMQVHPIDSLIAKPFKAKKPVILQINIEGQIGNDPLTSKHIQKILSQPEAYNFSEGQVKGILLRINSPGGSASVCSEMYADLMSYKQAKSIPIHTWIGDICASGGVYLSCASDYISAQNLSLIGSVGVRSKPNFNFYNWMQEHGISETTITAGKNKVHLPMFSKMPPGTSSYDDLIAVIDFIYDNFLGVVVKARGAHGLTKEKLVSIGASVYSSVKAQELGFIDEANVRYREAVMHLAKSLELDDYQVISFENPESYIDGWKKSIESKCSFLLKNTSKEMPFSLEADFSEPSA